MAGEEKKQQFMMLIFRLAAKPVILSLIEMHVRSPTVVLQSIRQAVCHLDGPDLVQSSVTEKQWTIETFDFDRRCREEFVRRSTPCPGPFCRGPRLPSRIAGISHHPRIERPADDVWRAMHGDCLGESCYAVPGP